MRTMHPVLVLGSYRMDQEWLPPDEFEERLRAVRAVMASRGWAGLIVHGNSEESALLTYLTNFYPRLRWTLALIPAAGEPRLLVAGAIRDLPAAAMLTWVKSVGWYGAIDQALPEWIAGLAAPTKGARPRLGVVGTAAMRPAVFGKVMLLCRAIAEVDEADEALMPLLVRKRPREQQMIREACRILEATVAAMESAVGRGAPTTTVAIEGEARARKLQAQDVRVLFSLDGGATLQPFEVLSDTRSIPFHGYVAVRYLGYWADTFLTIGAERTPVQMAAEDVLDAVISAAVPGATGRDLAEVAAPLITPFAPHPVTENCFGHAIGLALEDGRRLSSSSATVIEEGEFYSLRVGLTAADGSHAMFSAIIGPASVCTEILWHSH